MRVLALDLGSRRIGLATSMGAVAFPRGAIERCGDEAADRRRLVELAGELGASVVVVGLPLSMDGRPGPAARAALAERDALAAALPGVRVEAVDERLTTVSATRSLAAAGRRGRSARRSVDAAAATVLLQAWLDGQR